jgi:hypothetical protein
VPSQYGSSPSWLERAIPPAVSPVKTGFCVSLQSFVTCLLAGTPIQSETFEHSDAGTVGAACWLISS